MELRFQPALIQEVIDAFMEKTEREGIRPSTKSFMSSPIRSTRTFPWTTGSRNSRSFTSIFLGTGALRKSSAKPSTSSRSFAIASALPSSVVF